MRNLKKEAWKSREESGKKIQAIFDKHMKDQVVIKTTATEKNK